MARLCRINRHDRAAYVFLLEIYAGVEQFGGGLFDERPKTQTWVWDVFVLVYPKVGGLTIAVNQS